MNPSAVSGRLLHVIYETPCNTRPSESHDSWLLSTNVLVYGAFLNAELGHKTTQKEATTSV